MGVGTEVDVRPEAEVDQVTRKVGEEVTKVHESE